MKKGAYQNTVVGSLIFAKEYVTLYKQIKVYAANSLGVSEMCFFVGQ